MNGQIEAEFYRRMGELIEAKRKQRHMTQTDVAYIVGVHRNTILRWEQGESPVDMWNLLRLADALSCNHLLLLPPRECTWGALPALEAERDPKKGVQAERDPAWTGEARRA
jgi:transcriptional regulator with XRE-family HTH domain